MPIPNLSLAFRQAAALLAQADGLIITAGAGMGIDSGLPDFRGPGGFWGVYPALGRARLHFEEIANPQAFRDDPALAWGFYGHRLALYRATAPHAGYALLRAWGEALAQGAFVFTSNVDGHFQRAGFSEAQIIECHGSIHHLQCLAGCSEAIWAADDFTPEVDTEACRLTNTAPRCPHCGALARPNILMFGDWGWQEARTEAQYARFQAWRRGVQRPLVIEVGAGTSIPSVRHFGDSQDCPLIRINPDEYDIYGQRDVPLPCGGLAGLQGIAAALLAD